MAAAATHVAPALVPGALIVVFGFTAGRRFGSDHCLVNAAAIAQGRDAAWLVAALSLGALAVRAVMLLIDARLARVNLPRQPSVTLAMAHGRVGCRPDRAGVVTVARLTFLAAFAWRGRGPDWTVSAALLGPGVAWAVHAGIDFARSDYVLRGQAGRQPRRPCRVGTAPRWTLRSGPSRRWDARGPFT